MGPALLECELLVLIKLKFCLRVLTQDPLTLVNHQNGLIIKNKLPSLKNSAEKRKVNLKVRAYRTQAKINFVGSHRYQISKISSGGTTSMGWSTVFS